MSQQKSIFNYFSKKVQKSNSKRKLSGVNLNSEIIKREKQITGKIDDKNINDKKINDKNINDKNINDKIINDKNINKKLIKKSIEKINKKMIKKSIEKVNGKIKKSTKNNISVIKKENTPRKSQNKQNYMEMDWFKTASQCSKNGLKIEIPKEILKNATASVKRYLEIKTDYWEYIVFFKVGKFYELYDLDAVICHNQLGLNFMRGQERPHVGVPEKSYEKYVGLLVAKGFKVARVDQVETVKEMHLRVKKKKGDKVVMRDVTTVVTPGANFDLIINQSDDSVYLLSLVEMGDRFGVSFCDSASSKVFIGSFEDDIYRTRLRTLIASIRPGETVEPIIKFCPTTEAVLKERRNSVRNKLDSGLNRDGLMEFIRSKNYFDKETPKMLIKLLDDNLALSAFSSLLIYLNKLMVDKEVMSLQKFFPYNLSDSPKNLFLDGSTLSNLEIFLNEENSTEGTLFKWLDNCSTAFGRRMLRHWLEAPLNDLDLINERLDAIDDLLESPELAETVRKTLRSLPDIERLLGRLNSYAVSESKAVLYENIDFKYLKLFDSTVNGLRSCQSVKKLLSKQKSKISSKRLYKLIEEEFPNFEEELEKCLRRFNLKESLKEERIIPMEGCEEEFDSLKKDIKSSEKELEVYLESVRDDLGILDLNYFSSTIASHQIEIERSQLNEISLPENFTECSRTSKKRRFVTEKLKDLSKNLFELNERKESLQKTLLKSILRDFCRNMPKWDKVIAVTAEIDCLLSLYQTSATACGSMCRPKFFEGEPFLELHGSWHPCVFSDNHFTGSTDFVPNDISIGTSEASKEESRFVMVTGPNMGGKSTILRQSCVAVILAQIGCYVPAASCRLTLSDRIFTRIGANDAILANKSTFFVELEETANILKNATEKSLVVLDELGRGTSTFDGTAIAFAVSEYLCENIKCRTLFSTHYHILPEIYKTKREVSLYHMAYSAAGEKITFLYKFMPGVCKESHGINCARLAGIDPSVIKRAEFHSIRIRMRSETKSV